MNQPGESASRHFISNNSSSAAIARLKSFLHRGPVWATIQGMNVFRIVATALIATLLGCAPAKSPKVAEVQPPVASPPPAPPSNVIQASKADDLVAEVERIRKTLPKSEADGFQQAFIAVAALTALEHRDDHAAAETALLQKFNGKQPHEVVAEYQAMDPTLRAQMSFGFDEARKAAEATPADSKELEAKLKALLEAEAKGQ